MIIQALHKKWSNPSLQIGCEYHVVYSSEFLPYNRSSVTDVRSVTDLCPFTNAPNSHSLPIQLEFEWDPFKFKTAWNVNASHSTTTQLPFTPIHKPNSHSTVEFESLPFEKSIHLNGNLMVNFELPPINNTSLLCNHD